MRGAQHLTTHAVRCTGRRRGVASRPAGAEPQTRSLPPLAPRKPLLASVIRDAEQALAVEHAVLGAGTLRETTLGRVNSAFPQAQGEMRLGDGPLLRGPPRGQFTGQPSVTPRLLSASRPPLPTTRPAAPPAPPCVNTGPSTQTYFGPTLQRPQMPMPHFMRFSRVV